jgi:hypothetical protein
MKEEKETVRCSRAKQLHRTKKSTVLVLRTTLAKLPPRLMRIQYSAIPPHARAIPATARLTLPSMR